MKYKRMHRRAYNQTILSGDRTRIETTIVSLIMCTSSPIPETVQQQRSYRVIVVKGNEIGYEDLEQIESAMMKFWELCKYAKLGRVELMPQSSERDRGRRYDGKILSRIVIFRPDSGYVSQERMRQRMMSNSFEFPF